MNKYYFIVPALLMGGFIFLYRGATEEMERKEIVHKKEIAAKVAAEEAHRIEVEKVAQADAAKRQQEREREDKAKQDKKDKDYSDAMAKLKKETEGYSSEADKLAKESADLEIALVNTRTLRDKTNRESFELSKQVELAKINRRSAELEIQRLIEMVGSKAGASSLAALPPPPPAKK